MRQSLLRKPKSETPIDVILYLVSAGLIVTVCVIYPTLFSQFSEVAGKNIVASQVPYQVLSIAGNASLYSNISNLVEAFVSLNSVTYHYSTFDKYEISFSVGIIYENTSDIYSTCILHNFFSKPFPVNAIPITGALICRIFRPDYNDTSFIFYQIQPNGLDIGFQLIVPPTFPAQDGSFICVSDPVNYNYIV